MIIMVMGNHGSGKSTLVGNIADAYESVNMVTDAKKTTRNPVIMECSSPDLMGLCVIGYYHMGSYSGLDSGRFAGRMDEIFGWVESYVQDGWHVLMEGMLVSSMTHRFMGFATPIRPVYIDVSAEECAIAVAHRKTTSKIRHKHSGSPVNLNTLISKQRGCDAAYQKYVEAGIAGFKGNRNDCHHHIQQLLGLR